MPYVAIPSQLKNVESIYLELMSPEEMLNMSYGEVLTAETINYRTGAPQMNGLFCQAIFGPVKDWECACGKYKRYRYAGVICDKCGVEVTHSSVRRERMGHISLAAPCVHPWFLRLIPSRIALILDMKAADVNRVTYFSAYVITHVDKQIQDEYTSKIDNETQNRVKLTKSDYDKKFEELSRQYQVDKASKKYEEEALRSKYETDKDILKTQQSEMLARIETISEMAKKELTSLKYKDVVTEVQYQEIAKKFGPVFKAGIGAEAIDELLRSIDLPTEFEKLKIDLAAAKGQNKKKLAKRYKLVKNFIQNNTKPEWMILKRVMVLPPELRPMLQLDGGRFAASDLNELYRRLINRNNRLRKLIQIGAPEVILRNEKRMLQEAVEALIDNSAKGGRQVMASTGIKRPLKSLTDILKGKQGRFRQNLLGKRVDYSGRSVIIVGPSLNLDECGLPKEMALELFTPFLIGKIIEKSEKNLLGEDFQAFNVHSARRLIESKVPMVYDILDEVIKDKYVLLNRAPTLHRLSFLAFKVVLVEGKAIQLHPLVCRGFNADFDGDQMAVHLPITVKGQEESRELMVATRNLLKPASGELIAGGHQDIILGAYCLTLINEKSERPQYFGSANEALTAFNNQAIKLGELIKVRIPVHGVPTLIDTSVGRIIFNNCFPEDVEFINNEVNKKTYEKTLNKVFFQIGQDRMANILDTIKNTAFHYVTHSGVSISAYDIVSPQGKADVLGETESRVSKIESLFEMGLMTTKERHNQIISTWTETQDNVSKMVEDSLDPFGSVGMMIKSGSRGSMSQLSQMAGMKGLSVTASGEVIELPARHGYIEGLTGLEYFLTMKGARKALADIALRTADAGYLTRRLVDVAQNLIVTADDCGTHEGVKLTVEESNAIGKDIWERAYGRFLLEDIVIDGKTFAKAGDLLDHSLIETLEDKPIAELFVRSSTKCHLARGICQKCYGIDFSTQQTIKLGTAIGIIAAQSLGEPSTQLTMRSKHTGGVLTKSDITTGLPRVEEIFEARIPKVTAPMAQFSGLVEKVEGDFDRGYAITISSNKNVLRLPYNAEDQKLLVEEGKDVTCDDALVLLSTGEIISASQSGEVAVSGNEIIITQKSPEVTEYQTTPGMVLMVKTGQHVTRGQVLVDGPLDLQDLLDQVGFDALQEYIISQLNGIYSSNGINVNEKHIEVVIKQMCNKGQVIDAGDSELTVGDVVSLSLLLSINKKLKSEGSRLVSFKRMIVGISRSSLSTESFLSAASFQETSRVLVEAVISGRKDMLTGLKENVILGQLIPAGTGYVHRNLDATEVQEEFDEIEAIEVTE